MCASHYLLACPQPIYLLGMNFIEQEELQQKREILIYAPLAEAPGSLARAALRAR